MKKGILLNKQNLRSTKKKSISKMKEKNETIKRDLLSLLSDRNKHVEFLEKEIDKVTNSETQMKEMMQEQEQNFVNTKENFKTEIEAKDATIMRTETELQERANQISTLEKEIEAKDATIMRTETELQE